jgi:hypothetical protein
MIQPLDAFLDGLRNFLRGRGQSPRLDEARIAAALRHAVELAGERPEDEPAALLFALSRHARALGAAWEDYPLICARNMVHLRGLELDAWPGEARLENLRLRVAFGQAGFEEVREWVAAHVRSME